MKTEECVMGGKEFDIRDMWEDIDGEEFTCKSCFRKLVDKGINEGEVSVYADISEIPWGIDTVDDEKDQY